MTENERKVKELVEQILPLFPKASRVEVVIFADGTFEVREITQGVYNRFK